MISIKASNSLTTPNNMATGGSITSEAVCYVSTIGSYVILFACISKSFNPICLLFYSTFAQFNKKKTGL